MVYHKLTSQFPGEVRSSEGSHVELLALQMELTASELQPEAKILGTRRHGGRPNAPNVGGQFTIEKWGKSLIYGWMVFVGRNSSL